MLVPLLLVLPQMIWPVSTLITGGVVTLFLQSALRDRSGTYGFVAMMMVGFLINNVKWVSHMVLLIPALWLLSGQGVALEKYSRPAMVVGVAVLVLIQLAEPIRQLIIRLPGVDSAYLYGVSDVIAYSVIMVTLLLLFERFQEKQV